MLGTKRKKRGDGRSMRWSEMMTRAVVLVQAQLELSTLVGAKPEATPPKCKAAAGKNFESRWTRLISCLRQPFSFSILISYGVSIPDNTPWLLLLLRRPRPATTPSRFVIAEGNSLWTESDILQDKEKPVAVRASNILAARGECFSSFGELLC